MVRKVAIVTGANRGIGFYVARQLLQKFPGDVIVTARNSEDGRRACRTLTLEGLKPVWHELDITQSASIRMFVDFVRDNYGGIDVLVNNAGVIFPKDSPLSFHRQAVLAMQTNVKGTLSMCKYFLGLLRPHARVVNMSSEIGLLDSLSVDLRKQFDLDRMSVYDLDVLADKYVATVKSGTWSKYGWPDRIMETASVFINAMTYILSRDLRRDQRRNILVNAGCPGWTATEDMKTHLDYSGCLGDVLATTPDLAADDIAWLALLPSGSDSPCGHVVRKREIIKFK